VVHLCESTHMGLVDELKWRDMLFDMTPGAEEELASGMQTGYIGFDPTAPSLTIGNYVQIRILQLMQKHGHQPILLMGGATGRVGDPSGKDKERELLSYDKLDDNLHHQVNQAKQFLDFTRDDNPALLENNHDFYKDMNALEWLRDVGKHITVNYMMAKDSVKTRLETGISYTEFSYQLLQAYDYVCLYRKHGCKFQMGGSDQWGNITTGTDLVRRICGEKAYAITTPLLTKADGTKFGKSSDGNIWLDPKLTSPYKFYQYFINASDDDLPLFIKYFSHREKDEIMADIARLASDPISVKRDFALEITSSIHGEAEAQEAKSASDILFSRNSTTEQLRALSANALEVLATEIDSRSVARAAVMDKDVIHVLADASTITSSNGEARRAVKNNAVSVNRVKVSSPDQLLTAADLLHDRYVMIENGKKNKYLLIVE